MNKQQELLMILNEECSEVQKCISKFFRFGNESEYLKTNSIEEEVGDVMAMIGFLVREGLLDGEKILMCTEAKTFKLLNKDTTNLQCYEDLNVKKLPD